jgi:DNA polymerase-1
LIVVADIETEGLEDPKVIHCVVCKDAQTGEVYDFTDVLGHNRERFISFCSRVSHWIGHNFIAFDGPVLNRLLGLRIDLSECTDTLVVARCLNYNQEGGNSLEAWGRRLGVLKGSVKDFSVFTPEMLEYCRQDVEVTFQLYKRFRPYITSGIQGESIRLEHKVASLCNELNTNGFTYDITRSNSLRKELQERINLLNQEILQVFPSKPRGIQEVHPKITKGGTLSMSQFRFVEPKDGLRDLSQYNGYPFTRIEYYPFNPGSPKQCVDRLWDAGWEPFEKTKGYLQAERDRNSDRLAYYARYGWKVSDANLGTLPEDAPEAIRKLVQWLLLNSREKALETWENAYRPTTGRIHGRFNHIGAWTHRMSHAEPNMANIPSHIGRDGKPAEYGKEFRELWRASPGNVLVGCDADGIQLRVLAHYMDDPRFTQALIAGRKEDASDAHSLNQRALGAVCRSREVAKTFIYSWLLGAGEGKTAAVLGCGKEESRQARESFISFYPGLKELKKRRIPHDARRGFFTGFDGRRILCSSEHFMLAGYLQAGEAVVMKRACLLWKERLDNLRIPYCLVDFVHDEWQTECLPEHAQMIGQVQSEAIADVGDLLKLRCPMKGNFNVGTNWFETH